MGNLLILTNLVGLQPSPYGHVKIGFTVRKPNLFLVFFFYLCGLLLAYFGWNVSLNLAVIFSIFFRKALS